MLWSLPPWAVGSGRLWPLPLGPAGFGLCRWVRQALASAVGSGRLWPLPLGPAGFGLCRWVRRLWPLPLGPAGFGLCRWVRRLWPLPLGPAGFGLCRWVRRLWLPASRLGAGSGERLDRGFRSLPIWARAPGWVSGLGEGEGGFSLTRPLSLLDTKCCGQNSKLKTQNSKFKIQKFKNSKIQNAGRVHRLGS